MSRVPAALAAHLAGDVTTLCHCWTLSRADGLTLGFTDHDRPLTLDGVVHAPDSGFSPAQAEAALGLAIATDGIEGALSHEAISVEDLRSGAWDKAKVVTWLVNWADVGERLELRSATIARIEQADGAWRAEIEDLAAEFAVPRGRLARKRCDAELGDSRCTVDLQLHGRTQAAIVTAILQPGTVAVDGAGEAADGWFAGGRLVHAGRSFVILSHIRTGQGTATIRVQDALPAGISAGSGITLVTGCDKRFSTCKDKFSNSLNFRGFPHLPGNDAAYAYANDAATADGSPVVP